MGTRTYNNPCSQSLRSNSPRHTDPSEVDAELTAALGGRHIAKVPESDGIVQIGNAAFLGAQIRKVRIFDRSGNSAMIDAKASSMQFQAGTRVVLMREGVTITVRE